MTQKPWYGTCGYNIYRYKQTKETNKHKNSEQEKGDEKRKVKFTLKQEDDNIYDICLLKNR